VLADIAMLNFLKQLQTPAIALLLGDQQTISCTARLSSLDGHTTDKKHP